MPRFAGGKLASSGVTAAMRSGAATGSWTYFSLLFKGLKSGVAMLSRWLFGRVCPRWSQYQRRAAVQTPVTDLMVEVSHTHLQCEHNHLHRAQ